MDQEQVVIVTIVSILSSWDDVYLQSVDLSYCLSFPVQYCERIQAEIWYT